MCAGVRARAREPCECAEAGGARGGRGPSRQGQAWPAVLRLHLAGKPGAGRSLDCLPISSVGRIYILGVVEIFTEHHPLLGLGRTRARARRLQLQPQAPR